MSKKRIPKFPKTNKNKLATIADSSTAFFIDSIILIVILSVISDFAFPNIVFQGWLKLIIFVGAYIFYESVLLSLKKNTVGKFLKQIAVRDAKDNSKHLSFVNILIRTTTKFFLIIISLIISSSDITNFLHNKLSGSTLIKTENEKLTKIYKNSKLKFGFALFIFLLWIVWLNNLWLLLGIPILFDIYISKKVNWAFWNKRNQKEKNPIAEWFDAIIFAVVAASIIRIFFIEAYTIPTPSMEKSLLVGDYLFVSKVSYGPKVPNTPIAFPFVHHTLPFSKDKKSFSEIIQWPYHRLAGLGKVERNDAVVFNYPEGDTVSTIYQSNASYYSLTKIYGRENVLRNKSQFGDIIYRPVDKRENYIKRCVAIPGDTLFIENSEVFINSKPQENIENKQYVYNIFTNGSSISKRNFEKIGIADDDIHHISNGVYQLPLSNEKVRKIKKLPNVVKVEKHLEPKGIRGDGIFPHSKNYNWNVDNFGPLVIPKKDVTIDLNINNLPIYERLIDVYEENDLKIKGDKIFINNEEVDKYTFKMDYYWMMGDNRHNSADSRYWGFVPEDHIVGKAVFIWLSLDKDKSIFNGKIRWNRLFSSVK